MVKDCGRVRVKVEERVGEEVFRAGSVEGTV